MLDEVLGHELSLTYNLSGKGVAGKKAFQQLRLYRTILSEKILIDIDFFRHITSDLPSPIHFRKFVG